MKVILPWRRCRARWHAKRCAQARRHLGQHYVEVGFDVHWF